MSDRTYLAARGYSSWDAEPIADVALVVREGAVRYFGPSAAVARDGARDLGDVIIAPGFIDGHVHLHFDGGDDPIANVTEATDEELDALARRNARLLLDAGVTTARDLGSRGLATLALRDAIAAGAEVGPRLLVAGSPITTPDGHCWFLGGGCADAHAMLAAIDSLAEAGADWVKLIVSGGFLTATTEVSQPQFSGPDVAIAVEHAHALGLRVAAHAHSTAAVRTAVLAGVDTIEHATFISGDAIDFDTAVASGLGERGIAVCPTVNAATVDYPPQYGVEALERLRAMRELGAEIVIGTDAGVRLVTGELYARGLATLHEAGYRTRDLLRLATTGTATTLGLGGETGRLAAGLAADAVVLVSDPLDSTDPLVETLRPALVLARGREYTPRVVS